MSRRRRPISRKCHPIHIRKPRDAFKKPLGDAGILSDLETHIPDVVGGTLFSHRERSEPFACNGRSEADGVEKVASAWLDPRSGDQSACLDGSKVRVAGEVIQDLVDDILWDSGDDYRFGFRTGVALCFRDFRAHWRGGSWTE